MSKYFLTKGYLHLYMEEQNYITPIDQYVIDYVLSLRTDKDVTQQKIADLLGVKRSFIGNIESTNTRAKYNIRHINILADFFDLSPRDFFPEKPLKHFFPGRERKPIIRKLKSASKKMKSKDLKTAKNIKRK